jgi:DNA end-binding protein Ku
VPRAIWKGALSFGLVTVPVELVSAVGRQRPQFHLLHEKDESPVRYERVCQHESRPVPWGEIVKGFEYDKGRYVVLDKDDFKKAALERSDAIDILSFVPSDAIDARFFETPYYLLPSGAAAGHAYALLREAMRAAGKIGVAQIIMRQEQHIAALWARDQVMVLSMLRFAEELQDPKAMSLPAERGLKRNELDMAAKLIDSFAGEWEPEQYKDRYTANLMAIIRAKSKHGKPRLGAIAPPAPAGNVVDLMERLRESLGQRGERRAPARAAAARTRAASDRRRPARRPPAPRRRGRAA